MCAIFFSCLAVVVFLFVSEMEGLVGSVRDVLFVNSSSLAG